MGVIDLLPPRQHGCRLSDDACGRCLANPHRPTAPGADPGHFVKARTGCTYLTNDGPALAIALARALHPPTDLPTDQPRLATGPIDMATQNENERLTLSVAEAAELLGISRGTAYECVRSGEIPSVNFGRRVLIPRRRLEALLNAETPDNNEAA